MLIEACVATAVLLAVALFSASGSPSSTSASSGRLGAWGRAAVPAITSLIDDLGVIEADTAPGTTVSPASLGQAAQRLHVDLATAQLLDAPPNRTIAADWTQTLALLTRGEQVLGSAVAKPDPSTLALSHEQFATAGGDLLAVGQAIQFTP